MEYVEKEGLFPLIIMFMFGLLTGMISVFVIMETKHRYEYNKKIEQQQIEKLK